MSERHPRNGGGGSGNAAVRKCDEITAKRSSTGMPGSVPGAAVCSDHHPPFVIIPTERIVSVGPAQRTAATAVLALSRLLPRRYLHRADCCHDSTCIESIAATRGAARVRIIEGCKRCSSSAAGHSAGGCAGQPVAAPDCGP